MARYVADVLYVASIYPGELEPIRRNYGPSLEENGKNGGRSTLFQLKPVPRGGKPYVIEISDSFESVLDVMAVNSQNGPRGAKPRAPKPVPCEQIVQDILNIWTSGFVDSPPAAKPGIMQIANKQPTANELRQMMDQQTMLFEWAFAEGERLDAQHDWKSITGVMRLAAEWLGHKRAWSHQAIAADSGPCPLCTKMILNSAAICPECRQQISFAVDGKLQRFTAVQILSGAGNVKAVHQ